MAFNTVRHWLDALERLYLVFTIAPWTRSVARATQKARKLNLVDYGLVENRAARFENMVALELLRAVTLWNDLELGPFGLHFVRNKEKEEADFLITERRRPRLLVETKAAETRIDPALRKFQDQPACRPSTCSTRGPPTGRSRTAPTPSSSPRRRCG